MTGPIIGVTAYDSFATWTSWSAHAMLVPSAYVTALIGAGATPVLLPVGIDPAVVLAHLDGVVLVGGPDLDPLRYGERPHPMTQEPRRERDDFDLMLAASAQRQGLPLLAICRGLQVLNVQRGGSLHQHLPDVIANADHQPAPGQYGKTTVRVEGGTLLASLLGRTSVSVDCAHHQGVNRLGASLVATAFAADGTIEAIEDPTARFTLGVQWHPEVGDDPSIFEGFVRACVRCHRGAS